ALPAARPRQGNDVGGVLEGRQLLAVAEVAEANDAAADDRQPAAVRVEMDAFRPGPRRQVLPRRPRRQLVDADRMIRPAEGDQPAVRAERGGRVIILRHLQDRLAAAQDPHAVMDLPEDAEQVMRGQETAVGTEPGPERPHPEPRQTIDLPLVTVPPATQLAPSGSRFLRV